MRKLLLVLLVVVSSTVVAQPQPSPAVVPPGGAFVDDDGSVHEPDIEALAAAGITRGCNPPDNTRFCPDQPVTRGQMAALLNRALPLTAGRTAHFSDVPPTHNFHTDVSRLAAAGITRGCNPPDNTRFCPNDPVTRGQMAALLGRALDLPLAAGHTAHFTDTPSGHTFHADISRLAAAGITRGCNPPDNTRFCPDDPVTRGQMASMLQRALGLERIAPPPRTPAGTPTGDTLTGSVCRQVHGDATLVGTVTLTCDLVVHGGTLFARPGVTVNGNGHSIEFMHGARADWRGSVTRTWWDDGASFDLVRDINIRNVRKVMFHHGAGASTIRFVRIDRAGGPDVGDYPLHFHLNGNTTRGTLVEGVVVSNSRQRAFVPHGSHGITFRNTIAYNIRGEAYWWDQPPSFQSLDPVNNSDDILYERALAHTITNHPDDDRGYRLAAFELGAGLRNTVKDSIARNVHPSHPRDCSGFGWPEIHHGFGEARNWKFVNNASFGSACHGIFVWQNNNGAEHLVKGFRGDAISHGAYNSKMRYEDIDVERVVVHAQGWSVKGGSIGQVIADRHQFSGTITFTDVNVGSLLIQNRNNNGTEPGTYRFNNTGLRCSDVIWQNVVPGTRVVIEGSTC